MPIYAYKCSACGHAEDKLQKMSDAPLTVCPQCSQATYSKQVTAAGFQLKGSGWYVTDFRSNGSGGAKTSEAAVPVAGAEAAAGGSAGDTQAGSSSSESSSASSAGASSSEGASSSTPSASATPASPAKSTSGGSTGGGASASNAGKA
ncbi:MAG: FmdB family zinc ribbon protein [Alcaligenaceae bacterium]